LQPRNPPRRFTQRRCLDAQPVAQLPLLKGQLMPLPEGTPDLTSCRLARGHDWLAINKPAGIGMHSEDNVAGLVVQASNAFGQPLWPVHRLDKVTSGVLLLATSASGAARLSALFAEHKRSEERRVGKGLSCS